jgi:hypothetical protein
LRGVLWLVVGLLVLQIAAEVIPDLILGVPWTQPEAMKYGGLSLIAVLLVAGLVLRSRR